MPSHPSLAILGALACLAPAAAHADGSYFLLEVSTGLSEPASVSGDVGLSFGLTTGLTWRLGPSPLRLALLGTLAGRNASGSGSARGLSFSSERQDLDAYGSLRLGIPLVGGLRIYGEGGFGARFSAQSLQRGGGLGALEASASTPIVVGAAGLEYRFSERFSLGLRAELTRATAGGDLLAGLTGERYEDARVSGLAQLGFHF